MAKERHFRTEAEKAQDLYETAARKADAKRAQFEKIQEKYDRVHAELKDAESSRDYYAEHPLVKASTEV